MLTGRNGAQNLFFATTSIEPAVALLSTSLEPCHTENDVAAKRSPITRTKSAFPSRDALSAWLSVTQIAKYESENGTYDSFSFREKPVVTQGAK